MSLNRKSLAVTGVALLALILIVWCVMAINNKKEQAIADGVILVDDSVALTWVDAFTKRDFPTCDMLVENQNYRLYAPLVITHSRDKRYYDKVLNGMVDCIRAVSLVSVEGGTYKVKVSLVPYQPVGDFGVESVSELRGRYLEGSMADKDFTSTLQQLYYDVFSEVCFVPSAETVDVVVTLFEVELNGIMYVSGTVDFVDLILQESGLSDNFIIFEDSVKSEVDAMLKSDFSE